ncbi:MAG: glycoside hydrolase family 3 C-terminal domain-containing protein [Lachnospiraceae bacterium]|nr:glycoside hydrolase family 3 C-terminal domain-containing protein [Lachnospiraceae bacterium]
MKRNRIWTGLAAVTSFLLVLSVLGNYCMMGYAGTVNQALGIETSKVVNQGDTSEDTTYFESEYGELNSENLQKLIADTYDESVQEQQEGSVLLKNTDNALPLTEDEKNITLFGHATAQPLYKNSSAGSSGYKGEYCIDLYSALSDAGFKINDTLYDAYKESSTLRGNGSATFGQDAAEWSMGEEDISFYTEELRSSWEKDYNDVAVVMLSREAGEGVEVFTEDPDEGISQLALHQDEKDLLQMIKDSGKFEKTVVLLNSGNAMEVNWLDEYDVDACLWIGLPGQRGFEGVANLITGEVSPSGHLSDTYAVNSLSSPALVNGSYNNQTFSNQEEVTATATDEADVQSYVDVQVEGIYIGYKYYETRYEDTILQQGGATASRGSSSGSAWNYSDEVSYPFGYGLSYSTFEQKLDSVNVDGDTIQVQVTVTNTGSVAGKSAVQIYAQTPYGDYEKENLVEKSAIQLLDYGKTDILQPGESETITVDCEKYLLASYDYKNAKSYIMSEGNYYISIGDDAHDALNNVLAAKGATGMVDTSGAATSGNTDKIYMWSEQFDNTTYKNSQYTGEEVTNLFDDCDINYWVEGAVEYLSRQDWENTYPTEGVQVEATPEMIEQLNGDYYEKPEDSLSVADYTQGDNQNIPLVSLLGVNYDDTEWETYLNQFTIEEMATLLVDNFGTAEIASVGKPATLAGDGSDGVGGTFSKEKYGDDRDDCCFPCENVLACTFNKNLVQRRGELMGEEALYLGMAYVWMPGANLHRTPFGGRNFEYYSEDANLTYLCTYTEIAGIESKGIHAGGKHLVANDQENNRKSVACFFTEQALREGGLRAFEGGLAKGNAMAVMEGFNRIGLTWCSSSEALGTKLLRNEWGFEGIIETDGVGLGELYMTHYTSSLKAGTNIYCLDFNSASYQTITEQILNQDDGNMLGILRESVHRQLYTIVNSAVMNGYSTDSIVESVIPWWQPVMLGIIVLFAALEILFLILLFRGKRRETICIEEEK